LGIGVRYYRGESTESALRFSVVVPTHERRDVAVAGVRALALQRGAPAYEVVVVVDGSTDGTADALRALELPVPLRVVEQERAGASAARNRGAAEARGEILLFLDDDMEADPGLLAAHERRHRAGGADAVVGHVPLHPASPETFLAARVARWADARRRQLLEQKGPLAGSNFLTGQVSIRRDRFLELGGFDLDFTRGGGYGREDTDLGVRLVRSGGTIVFEPEAVSWHRYVVSLAGYLRQRRQAGRAAVALLRKHRDLPEFVVRPKWRQGRYDRFVGRWLALVLAPPLLALLGAGFYHPRLGRLFFWLQFHAYWRGVREAGGYPDPRPARVLAWHAIRDLAGTPHARLGVAPERFRRQLATLARAGFRFVSAEEVVALVAGAGGVPRGAVLLTFDDAYDDLASAALPILAERRAPAASFAVSAHVGGTNAWDERLGLPALRLADAAQLRAAAAAGVEIGAHSRTHPALDRLEPEALGDELAGAADELAALGLPRPRLLAWPYGRSGARERAAARAAGYAVAFTTEPGRVEPGSDPYALPRIEIGPRDVGLRLLVKVLLAGRGPARRRRVRSSR
jgi:peptidoglycan/xylan/chitin deacetylase (PgdA/CDA1 family)/glycosyltransferase involved in cell wall biosynthesis